MRSAYRKPHRSAAELYAPTIADIVRPAQSPAKPTKPRFSTVALEGGCTLITLHPKAWRTVQPAPVKGLAA